MIFGYYMTFEALKSLITSHILYKNIVETYSESNFISDSMLVQNMASLVVAMEKNIRLLTCYGTKRQKMSGRIDLTPDLDFLGLKKVEMMGISILPPTYLICLPSLAATISTFLEVFFLNHL